jgi:hypothetical protein
MKLQEMPEVITTGAGKLATVATSVSSLFYFHKLPIAKFLWLSKCCYHIFLSHNCFKITLALWQKAAEQV